MAVGLMWPRHFTYPLPVLFNNESAAGLPGAAGTPPERLRLRGPSNLQMAQGERILRHWIVLHASLEPYLIKNI